ncbi:cation:proton antiporter [Streptomyces murinus]|uniref:cation:proton antiporter n=1 Tax=Streptomyces murinus TaxID=33900 RepID=UPI002E81D155|nr:cation:proton antiporter [Streptomyces murinus]WUD10483.1 cation:proton antiporter [Streptomyces murinus]
MSLEAAEVAHLLLALIVLLTAAHLGGHLFARLRQPQVIGEIAGGLVLGPTVLGEFAPGAWHWLFPAGGATASVLGAFYQLGMLLLVYLTGAELRARREAGGRRTIMYAAISGLALPFAFGLAVASAVHTGDLAGPHGSPAALALVFGMAVAVTSVPVISRIMLDLGILRTLFARIVLAVAVIEDILLYVVLAIVLGMAQARGADAYGLWASYGSGELVPTVAYFTVVPLLFLALSLWLGPRLFVRLSRSRANVLERRSPLAFRLVVVFLLCAACGGLGIDPIFGALVAGMCVAGASGAEAERSQETLRQVSLGFFVPVYFAIVGIKLDLVRHFDPVFFCWFLALACLVKSASVWLGARLAGESSAAARNLAVAMNARGGPGIVLASVAFGAHLINENFFTSLVLLSIVTSQFAGFWLGRIVAGDKPLMPGPTGETAGSGAGREPLVEDVR